MHFERVTKVAHDRLRPRQAGTVLNLLPIIFEATDAPSGAVTLIFSGGAAVRLDVECIEAQMRDLGPRWHAEASRPSAR